MIYLLSAMSHYKIKLEDKAAFLNRLEKQDIHIGSYDITDNKYEGYFEIDINDENDNDIIKSMLNKSPKINTIKEMKQQITKTQLKQIIREELGKMKGQEEPMNEELFQTIGSQLGLLVGMAGGLVAFGKVLTMIAAKKIKKENPEMSEEEVKKEAIKQLQQGMNSSMGQSAGTGIGGNK